MATKTAVATGERDEVRTVTVTRTVTIPMFKKCADHEQNFPGEDPIRPITEFWGKIPGSYCARCNALRHKARAGYERERRQREREELREYRALKAEQAAKAAAAQ
jgi:hypothetical protein